MNMIEKRRQMRGQGGFTLIELLVVIAILGILAGVAVFAIGNIQENAERNACITEREVFEVAEDALALDTTPGATMTAYVEDPTGTYFQATGTPLTTFTAIGTLPAGC